MINTLNEILEKTKNREKPVVTIAGAEDEEILRAIIEAQKLGIANGFLVGNPELIKNTAYLHSLDISPFEIVPSSDTEDSSHLAVSLVTEGKSQIVMKGQVLTSTFLKAILDKDKGLRTGRLFSHVGIFEVPNIKRLLVISDAAMNISPTLKEKVDILLNALEVTRVLDIEMPKVAVLAAVEVVSENMPATIDAAILSKMNERGQLKGCIIDGPLALDCALSKEAAEHKGIKSKVAGEADVLLVPDIEAGNFLYKSFIYAARGETAGVVMGARSPVILTSRADSHQSKLYSIALATLLSLEGLYA